MTSPSRQEVELANDIAGIVFEEIKRVWPDLHPLFDLRYGIADRVIALPLLNRVRAEALREAADALDATTELLNPSKGHELAYINCTRIDAQELRHRANSIEQNSEGNET